MTRQDQIEKQDFLMSAQAMDLEGLIVCPRCEGWGNVDHDSGLNIEDPCELCRGQKVIRRRVVVVVMDSAVGGKE